MNRPMTEMTAKTAMMTSPVTTLGERGMRTIRSRWNVGGGPATGGCASVVLSIVISSGHLPRPRVDHHVDDVSDQVGRQHNQGDDHEDALDQRVVELRQRIKQVKADAGIVEDDLGEDLAADDKAGRA